MGKPDARRYKRMALSLPARISVNAGEEIDGMLLNISPGDMAVQSDAQVVAGDAVSVRIKDLDVIEGTVARTFPDGFAVSFLLSKKRRAQLTERLMVAANAHHAQGLDDQRKTLRHQGPHGRTFCRLENGMSLFVRIVDYSVDGVSVDAPKRPPIGSEIHVGRRPGVVTRHTQRGFVVVYREPAAGQNTPALRQVV